MKGGHPNPQRERQVWKDRFAATLTIDALLDSITTLLNQDAVNSATMTELGFNPLHEYREFVARSGYYGLFSAKNAAYRKQYAALPMPNFSRPSPAYGSERPMLRRTGEIGRGAPHTADGLYPPVPRRLSRHARLFRLLGKLRGLETSSRRASQGPRSRRDGDPGDRLFRIQRIHHRTGARSLAIQNPKCVGTGSPGTTRARLASTSWSASSTEGRVLAASSPPLLSNPLWPRYATNGNASFVFPEPARPGAEPAGARI